MKDSLRTARSFFRMVMVLCGALAVFAAATESTRMFTEAKKELQVLSDLLDSDTQDLHDEAQEVLDRNIRDSLPYGLSGRNWPCMVANRDALHVLAVAGHKLGPIPKPSAGERARDQWVEHVVRKYLRPSLMVPPGRPWSYHGQRPDRRGYDDYGWDSSDYSDYDYGDYGDYVSKFIRTIENFTRLNDGWTGEPANREDGPAVSLGRPAPSPATHLWELRNYLERHVLAVMDRPRYGDLLAKAAEKCTGRESFTLKNVSIRTADGGFSFAADVISGKENARPVGGTLRNLERRHNLILGWYDTAWDSSPPPDDHSRDAAAEPPSLIAEKARLVIGGPLSGLWEGDEQSRVALPKCGRVWHLIWDKPVNDGIRILEERERSSGFQLRFLGMEIPLPVLLLAVAGPVVTLVFMLVLASYVSHLVKLAGRLPDAQVYEITTFPWEALFDEPLAHATTAVSLNLVPWGANAYFLYQTIGKGVLYYWSGWVALGVTLAAGSLGVVTYYRIEKLNRTRRELEKITCLPFERSKRNQARAVSSEGFCKKGCLALRTHARV